MERFLLNSEDYQKYYGVCGNFNVSTIPLSERQNIPQGVFFLTIGLIELILYIPCLIAIRRHLENSCYKFMFVMGLLDLPGILISAVITGIFGIIGAVYCTAQTFQYVVGTVALAVWCAESGIEILLAINRCIDVGFSKYSPMFYSSYRTWLWMLPTAFYALAILLFEKPTVFCGNDFAWFFNPLYGIKNLTQSEIEYYGSKIEPIHNMVLCFGLTGTYFIFGLIFVYQTGAIKRAQASGFVVTSQTYDRNMIFVQVILISFFNVGGATIYVYMQFNEVSEVLIVAAQFFWSQSHGIPPIIYLLLNRTLRADCVEIVKKFLNKFGVKFQQIQANTTAIWQRV